MENGICIDSCSDGNSPDADKVCQKCHESCSLCTGLTENDCQTCAPFKGEIPGGGTGKCTSTVASG